MADMFEPHPVSHLEAEQRLQGELRDGEHLLWAGRPRIPFLVWSALPVSIFGLFFGGFALFWIIGAATVTRSVPSEVGGGFGLFSLLFPLFGLPFLLVGLGLILSPWLAKLRLKKTFYGVTDQRAILLEPSGFSGVETRFYPLADLERMVRTQKADGSGDLVFEEETQSYRRKGRSRTRHVRHGFMGIEEVRRVEDLIRARRQTLGLSG